MFRWMIDFSIRHWGVVLAGALLLIAGAAYQVPRMPLDIFPELNAPTVTVLTEAGGLSADEVEQYVTFPIESAMNGLPGVRRVRSTSALSLSVVYVEFDWGQDIFRARQLVSERLAAAREALPPEGVHAEIGPVNSITGEIMLLSLSSPNGLATPMELRGFAEFELRNRLLAVPGVTQVVAIGGELPEYQVLPHPENLLLYRLTFADVAAAAREAHSVASAGYLPQVEGKELPLRQQARITSTADIASTLIRMHEGRPLTLGQVAEVRLAGAPRRGTGSEGGRPAVVISVQKAPGTNTLALTAAVDEALDEIDARLPAGMALNRHVMRQADFIGRAVENVERVLFEAVLFVAIVVALFLMNARTTFITLTALPLSLAVAFLALWAMGLTINVMTLGGLAIAIGELVDDAIIDVENVFRRLGENAKLPLAERLPAPRVVFDASNEVRGSVVFATVIICVVFVPLLFLDGLEGRFFRPLGIAYIVSIMASLFVAVTVTPALCRVLLTQGGADHGDGPLARWLRRAYAPSLLLALRHRWLLFGAMGALLAGSLALARTYGSSFLPAFNEGTFTVFLMGPPGTSLEASDRLAPHIERRLAAIPGVATVARRTGRAERDEHAEPVSNSELEVSLREDADQAEVRRRIDAVLASVPGVTTMVGQPIEHRLSHILSGTPAAVAINVYGEDLDGLRRVAKEIESALKRVPGARDVNANRELMIETLPIHYRAAELAALGLTPADAAEQVSAAFNGIEIAQVNAGVRRYAVSMRLPAEERASPRQVGDFVLRSHETGALSRLREVADVGVERASNLIVRENGRRKATVSLNVADGHNLGQLVEVVRSVVDPIVLEAGYSVAYGGQFEAQQSASRTILAMGALALGAIFLLLRLALRSGRAALLVMVNLPLALIGGIAAVFIAESPSLAGNAAALLGFGGRYTAPVLSIASMVGFVTLFGIAVRNGILLVNHYAWLREHEGLAVREAVLRGSSERLAPVLMTALSAALGLIPLALAAGRPGSELLAPLAVVVLGGLTTSTFLNLVVVPAGYDLLFGSRKGTA
ncbi:MAG: efflux RND transporter permease subunit [Candidatus Sumerlaeia bacterium]|nr:efflux RND transporter permease subunit [Candidatus Sumerlaeia bacterium]